MREIHEKGICMKIKALENYFDLEKHKQILKNDVYEVSQKRAKVICDKKLAEVVETNKNGEQVTEPK